MPVERHALLSHCHLTDSSLCQMTPLNEWTVSKSETGHFEETPSKAIEEHNVAILFSLCWETSMVQRVTAPLFQVLE